MQLIAVYKPQEEDAILLGTLCPNFERETSKVLANQYSRATGQTKMLNYINTATQINVTNPLDVSLLYLAVENSVSQLSSSLRINMHVKCVSY